MVLTGLGFHAGEVNCLCYTPNEEDDEGGRLFSGCSGNIVGVWTITGSKSNTKGKAIAWFK